MVSKWSKVMDDGILLVLAFVQPSLPYVLLGEQFPFPIPLYTTTNELTVSSMVIDEWYGMAARRMDHTRIMVAASEVTKILSMWLMINLFMPCGPNDVRVSSIPTNPNTRYYTIPYQCREGWSYQLTLYMHVSSSQQQLPHQLSAQHHPITYNDENDKAVSEYDDNRRRVSLAFQCSHMS